jgi:hypothetical protein
MQKVYALAPLPNSSEIFRKECGKGNSRALLAKKLRDCRYSQQRKKQEGEVIELLNKGAGERDSAPN